MLPLQLEMLVSVKVRHIAAPHCEASVQAAAQ
jgi:hypothetical protein